MGRVFHAIQHTITELPRRIADKIAAGEVVDRPVSIVKELVENSIDAGADFITVEIKNGGKSYIRVTDNGCGIQKEFVTVAFKRHATSKISQIQDLDAIETLGFRGEALASIAAVSRIELTTKAEGEKLGTHVLNRGGDIISVEDTGCADGTTVVVRDLFFNTPARLKFLKADNTESSLIIDFMTKMTLAYPDIRIRMINNSNTLFTTPGRGDRLAVIATVFDPNTAKKLIKIENVDSGASEKGAGTKDASEKGTGTKNASAENEIKIEGYISPPEMTKTNRKNQIFFVNGRYVHSKVIEKAISDGYKQRLFDGRYPIAFIFIDINPALLDVNIHPNKSEIRFDNDVAVYDAVLQAVKAGLGVRDALGSIKIKTDDTEKYGRKNVKSAASSGEQVDLRSILRKKREEARRAEGAGYYGEVYESDSAAGEEISPYAVESVSGGTSTGSSGEKSTSVSGSVGEDTFDGNGACASGSESNSEGTDASVSNSEGMDASVCGDESDFAHSSVKIPENLKFIPHIDKALSRPFDISEIRPIGSIFGTYILGVSDDTFYMIDQHAAHERIFFEKLTKSFYSEKTASQLTMTPIRIDVSYSVKEREEEWIGFLEMSGFDISQFGPKTYAFKAFPSYMSHKEAEIFLDDFFDSIEYEKSFRSEKTVAKIITRACKSAVKGNTTLSDAEIESLLKQLAKAENPFSCPHGRPTVIRLKRTEIEALFKR